MLLGCDEVQERTACIVNPENKPSKQPSRVQQSAASAGFHYELCPLEVANLFYLLEKKNMTCSRFSNTKINLQVQDYLP
jgi:hypothetical protein